MDIKSWLINWFSDNTAIDQEEITNNCHENYFLLKWIDSLKFISLISAIEDTFGINFSNDEFQDRKFATINGLEEVIKAKMDAP
jgi:acyl carrier protein